MTRDLVAFRRPLGGQYTSAYATPLLAALMRPVHEYEERVEPVRVRARVLMTDGLRFAIPFGDGTETIEPAVLPDLSASVRTAFAVLCAHSVHKELEFSLWADAWLVGTDRSAEAARRLMLARILPPADRAYVSHWALMTVAFPSDAPCLAAQTAALVASLLFPAGTFDFNARAEAAREFA